MDKSHLKGSIAESIVKLMFEASGVPIHQNSQEKINPTFFDAIKRSNPNTIAKKICSQPDFAIEHQNMNLEFIEVKYRQQGRFLPQEVAHIRNFESNWNATIVMLSLNERYSIKRIQVIRPPYNIRDDGNVIDSLCPSQIPEWRINPVVLDKCVCLVELVEVAVSQPFQTAPNFCHLTPFRNIV